MSNSPAVPAVNGSDRPTPRRFMLISSPRTCSNLLVKVLDLDNQPATRHGSYHFMPGLFKLFDAQSIEKSPDEWDPEFTKGLHEFYQGALEKFQTELIPTSDDGTKIIFTKEHAAHIADPVVMTAYANGLKDVQEKPFRYQVDGMTTKDDDASPPSITAENFTVFPDEYLETWSPIFLIRHPARAFESMYRSMRDLFDMKAEATANATEAGFDANMNAHLTYRWTRILYEWYTARGIQPVVIDADDIIVHTKAVTQKLAHHIGFAPESMVYTWEQASHDEKHSKGLMFSRMLDSLHGSQGIQADPNKVASSVGSTQSMVPKWQEKFGEKPAVMLQEKTDDAMADYVWLHERRMMP